MLALWTWVRGWAVREPPIRDRGGSWVVMGIE